ncbi:translation factor GUF1 homolog, mitochondrial-like [Photinus pyralis]|nr:translation factor GUF1 homolog, mitochondrial-like [Photinus pyralis]XP_031341371.1 translation factor GUF1 homolog, mitochondrial-like [Photinus pyralis]
MNSVRNFIRFSNRNIYRKGFHDLRTCWYGNHYSTDETSKLNIDYADIPIERIRNFSIIAHVDHGKSTLADRVLETTGAIKPSSGNAQVLDKLQVERERGITVKAQSASLLYNYNGSDYLLNLIDTPGHVDFSNEVSRSLSACQGVILLVDANDGVQAQTVANFYLAFGNDLIIIPVLNKIDLKNADPDRVAKQLETLFDIDPKEVLKISAKLGTGIHEVLEAVIKRLPPPHVERDSSFKALLFDSWYDRYRGVQSLVYVQNGQINVGDNVTYYHTNKNYEVKMLSILKPEEVFVKKLVAGQIGVICCNMRSSKEAHIGDTVHKTGTPVEPLKGFKPVKPMVFAGIYPVDQSQHVNLRSAIEKLALNDSAVSISIDTSPALGQGWRLGFLGLLHLEVFTQRLQQEYDAETILTAPSVTYKVKLKETKQTLKAGNSEMYITNPIHFPDHLTVEEYYEPMVLGTIITPDRYLGAVLTLCLEKRGVQRNASNIDNERVMMQFDLPLSEIVIDFHDSLKTISSGYASFDYEPTGFVSTYLVKMEVYLNGVAVDELSSIIHGSRIDTIGRRTVLKLKEIIPRQLVQIAIQAKVNGKVIARETLKAYRKDVAAKLYGGDITRRMKLLAQQAAGKKKMKMVANISLPRETFIDVLKK